MDEDILNIRQSEIIRKLKIAMNIDNIKKCKEKNRCKTTWF
jgi:hypothetical protein